MGMITQVGSSRSLRNAAHRTRAVVQRFGVGPGQMARALRTYVDLAERYQCRPTFPVTAVLVERHPRLFRELVDRGVELAIHGYVHANYRLVSTDRQREHFSRAIEVFQRHNLPFTGFRSPYLSWSDEQMQLVADLGFSYSSNRTLAWQLPSERDCAFGARGIASYEKVLEFYRCGDLANDLSLPGTVNGILDLPVAMPDDESLIDRLAVGNGNGSGNSVWLRMLQSNHRLGELLVLNLHPERAPIFAGALEAVLHEARRMSPPVWVATLEEVASWWRQREATGLILRQLGDDRYQVSVDRATRAAILVRNARLETHGVPWLQGYERVSGRGTILESPSRPCIGVSPDCPPNVSDLFRCLGFLVEESRERQMYGVYFDGQVSPEESPRSLLAAIYESEAPLVRLALWPEGAACALAVTGDVDCITLGDFVRRFWEV